MNTNSISDCMLVRDEKGRFKKDYKPWNKGIPCRGESKRKLSEKAKRRYRKGFINPFKGKKHSEKSRTLISKRTKEAMKNPEIRKLLSQLHKSKHHSPKTEFTSQGAKEKWKNPKYRKIMQNLSKGENNPFFGKQHTKETREKLSKRFSGKKNHFWKGGVSKENERLRRSLKSRLWREAVFKRDNYTCQKCGFQCGNGKHIDLHPHHIKLFSSFPELRFDVNNGVTLCKECHMKEHNLIKKGGDIYARI